MPLLLLAALLIIIAVLLCRVPLEWWVVASTNTELKQFARFSTVGVLIFIAVVCIYGALRR